MPRNFLKDRSIRDLASEYVVRKNNSLAPVKLYSTDDILRELNAREGPETTRDALAEAYRVARILGD